MIVVEKNYRLQDIQLSKSPPSRPTVASARQATFAAHLTGLPSRSLETRPLGEAKAGGEYRARTGDLLVANQALSQLS